jgi:hypothetical protein
MAPPTLIRRAPAAASSSRVQRTPLMPASTLSGFGATAATTARTWSRVRRPGA